MTKHRLERIFLSPPHMGGEELNFIKEAFESNYIAPLGPMVDAFEKEFAEKVGIAHAVAVASGTAAMHLALRVLGVRSGDEVIASTLTFIGGVSPVIFQGANLTFVDCDRSSWNMDPDLLAKELKACQRRGRLPKAVIPTDLYGQCCDLQRILDICHGYDVPVICDSAEALGARYLTQRRKGAKAQSKNNKKNLFMRVWELRRQFFRLMEIRLLRLRAGGCWFRMIRNSLIMPAIYRNRPGNPFQPTSIKRSVIIIA